MIPNSLKLGVGFAIAIALLGVMFYLVGIIGPSYASSSNQDGAPPVLTGDDVIEYDQFDNVPLINPVRRIIQGEVIDGGCRFTSYMEPPPGQRYTMGRTLAVNWTRCEKLEEHGGLSDEDGEAMMEDEEGATGEATPQPENPDRSLDLGALIPMLPQCSNIKVAKLKT